MRCTLLIVRRKLHQHRKLLTFECEALAGLGLSIGDTMNPVVWW